MKNRKESHAHAPAAQLLTSPTRRRLLSRALFDLVPLESRQLLSVSAATILGPQNTGDTSVYSVSTPGLPGGTLTRTFQQGVTFNGNTTIQLDNAFQLSGGDSDVKDYYGFDSSGNYVFFGSTSANGTLTVPTPGILNPTTQNANQTYTEAFTEQLANGSSAVVTHHIVLKSTTPSPITVPAGTFEVYENDDTITIAGAPGSVIIQHFLSPLVGEVEFTDTVTAAGNVTTTYSLTSVSGPGIGSSTDKLAFVQGPNSITAGVTLSPAPVVDVEDSNGNILSSDTSNVTLTISGNGSLSGTTTVAAVNGVATFSNVTITSAGTYTITASDGLDAVAVSPSLTVASSGGGGGGGGDVTVSIAKSSFAASVVAGSTVTAHITVDLTNPTNATISGSGTVGIYATTDGTVDGSAILLGSTPASVSVKPNHTLAIPVSIVTLPSTLNGTYTLIAQVTSSGGNPLDSTTGPTLTAAAPFIALSDTLIGLPASGSGVSGAKTTTIAKVGLTNHGNILSSGNTTVAIYVSPDGTVANGTLVRSISAPLSIKPGITHFASVPLLALPALPTGNYFVVAQVTDPNSDITTVTSSNSYALAAPFISLIPTAASLPTKQNSQGVFLPATFSFTLTNIGNINATGTDTITLLASATNNLVGATVVLSMSGSAALKPSVPHAVHFKLTPSQVNALKSATLAALQVTDSNGVTQTLNLNL